MSDDRGMKKWLPFASLVEQAEALEKMHYRRNKIAKPQISNERAEKINNILTNYKGEELLVTFYYDGYLYNIKGKIKKIDLNSRTIYFEKGQIPLKEIIDIVANDTDF